MNKAITIYALTLAALAPLAWISPDAGVNAFATFAVFGGFVLMYVAVKTEKT